MGRRGDIDGRFRSDGTRRRYEVAHEYDPFYLRHRADAAQPGGVGWFE